MQVTGITVTVQFYVPVKCVGVPIFGNIDDNFKVLMIIIN